MHDRANPFIGYGTMIKDERLVGRGDCIRELERWLLEDVGSVNLVGMPRVGKSSTLRQVLDSVARKKPELAILKVTLEQHAAPQFFYEELLAQFGKEMARLGIAVIAVRPASGSEPGRRDYDSFIAFRDALAGAVAIRPQLRVVAAIDELDRVCTWPGGAEVIRQLRSMANDTSLYRLSCALASRRRLRVIEQYVTGVSTFAEMCHVQFLPPLDRTGLEAMVKRAWRDQVISTDDIGLLDYSTGGHPFLAEMCLYHAWEKGSFTIGIQRALTQTMEYYEKLRHSLDDDSMFLHLMRAAVRPRLKLPDLAFANLLDYGLVRPSSEGVCAWSDHFQLHLERSRRQADDNDDTWCLWRSTEVAIRDFIESTLEDAMGAGWESVIAGRHQAVASMLKSCSERAERERQNFRLPQIGRLLDYTYPNDLWLILNKEWANFSKLLTSVTKPELQRDFEAMARVRTPVAHNRIIPQAEEDAARVAYRRVVNALAPGP